MGERVRSPGFATYLLLSPRGRSSRGWGCQARELQPSRAPSLRFETKVPKGAAGAYNSGMIAEGGVPGYWKQNAFTADARPRGAVVPPRGIERGD